MKRSIVQGEELSSWRNTLLPTLSLFTSMGTLVCCALPALLVTLGMGAALAGLVGAAPWLGAISEHKEWIFAFAGLMLGIAVVMQWRARLAPCPIDPVKAKACMRLRKISWMLLSVSLLVYFVGVFFAFFAARIFFG